VSCPLLLFLPCLTHCYAASLLQYKIESKPRARAQGLLRNELCQRVWRSQILSRVAVAGFAISPRYNQAA
jgi:hypothetical protein